MPNEPDWILRAEALERENRLTEAEDVISKAIQDQGFALTIAGMYRRRMIRLRAIGNDTGAAEARKKASDWAYFYASQATSGGEGMALSHQRDTFLSTL